MVKVETSWLLFLLYNGELSGVAYCFLMYFQSKTTFLQQINVQNVNPVYGTGIRSHNLLIMNLLL